MINIRIVSLLFAAICLSSIAVGQENFRVWPYLQNPASDGMTVVWFSETSVAGTFHYQKQGSDASHELISEPVPASSLSYSSWEESTFFENSAPSCPYKHRVRLEELEPATTYGYSVTQGISEFSSTFRTAPEGDSSIRVIIYGDAETEPESTGSYAIWNEPVTGHFRNYLVDQTTGYRNNLEVIKSRDPDLVFVAGDLVESGGEQRDWDEFWRHNATSEDGPGLAGKVPLLGALGNHEYYAGPSSGQYGQPYSEYAVNRFLTYFEHPPNGSDNPKQEGRYYSIKYGPVSFVVLDVCNNSPDSTAFDTNYFLLGEHDPGGGNAPDFGPGSRQYEWMEEQLAQAREQSLFTFVVLHHAPYSSGPHAYPPGTGPGQDQQSGYPVRQLSPLLMKYGVDAVFSGHDEMWERSELAGSEILSDGSMEPHTIQFYDVGMGGDGLRSSYSDTTNPNLVFLADTDAPEVWDDSVLLGGGKHYGHLELDVVPGEDSSWQAILKPVYILPVRDSGEVLYTKYERRLYDDQVTLILLPDTVGEMEVGISPANTQDPEASFSFEHYPNPFHEGLVFGTYLPEPGVVTIRVYDIQGRVLKRLGPVNAGPGYHAYAWDGMDEAGMLVPPGLYYYRIETGTGLSGTGSLIKGAS